MIKTKKITLSLAVITALSLIGCGSGGEESGSNSSNTENNDLEIKAVDGYILNADAKAFYIEGYKIKSIDLSL